MEIASLDFFYRTNNQAAAHIAARLKHWLEAAHPDVAVTKVNPQLVLALGGDGTILEAAREYINSKALIVGFNLGTVGFLAAVNEESEFETALAKLIRGYYQVSERLVIEAAVVRKGKAVFKGLALNDVVVKSPLSIVNLAVAIDGHPYQYVRGSGLLVATATGSTAYNLSAHGPIVMPDIPAMVLTELLDHNLPTPSIVVGESRVVTIKVGEFRPLGQLQLNNGEPVDVVLSADGTSLFSLVKGDEIIIKKAAAKARFAEVDPNSFFSSLQEKFTLK